VTADVFTLALKHSRCVLSMVRRRILCQGGLALGHVIAETGKYHWDELPHLRQIPVCILWSTGSFHYVTPNSFRRWMLPQNLC
jgi:hypothetical protein